MMLISVGNTEGNGVCALILIFCIAISLYFSIFQFKRSMLDASLIGGTLPDFEFKISIGKRLILQAKMPPFFP